jgi:thiosulfate/3-mercaptopyruvate sulfurtransferase
MALSQQQRVVLIDARPAKFYEESHLPNAISIPFTATFVEFGTTGRVITLDKAKSLFSNAGIRNDDLVVAYDGGGMLQASRMLWTLEVYGHKKVKLLDGGLKAWQQAGLAVTQDKPTIMTSNYVPSINPDRLATRLTTLLASNKTDAFTLIDAREVEHYEGLKSEAKRYGHIPNAKGFDITKNIDDKTGTLRPISELKELYASVPKNKKVIIYCTMGDASSLEYLVMRELGYDVANYDASWQEWGNDLSLPIVEPKPKE